MDSEKTSFTPNSPDDPRDYQWTPDEQKCPNCQAVLIDSEGDLVSMVEHVQATECPADIAAEYPITLDEAIARIRSVLGARWMP